MSKGLWGADTTDERKPTWPWVSEYIGNANCFATGGGWTLRWPWGDEVIVALSNLTTKLGTANVASAATITIGSTGLLVNAATQSLYLLVDFNEAVTVGTPAPTLSLISGDGTSANITLTYNVAGSDATAGRILFGNAGFTLAAAGYAANSLVANSSSVVTNWNQITDAATANLVANGVPAAVSVVIPVYQQLPVHTGTARVGTAANTAGQYLSFVLKFNQAVVLSTVPLLTAIANTGTAAVANVVLTYTGTGSSLALGNLVFVSAAQDYSTLVANAQYCVNALSTNASTLWTGIKNAIGGVAANLVVVANTFTVTLV